MVTWSRYGVVVVEDTEALYLTYKSTTVFGEPRIIEVFAVRMYVEKGQVKVVRHTLYVGKGRQTIITLACKVHTFMYMYIHT